MKRSIRLKIEEIRNFIRFRRKGAFLNQAKLIVKGKMRPATELLNIDTVRKPREGWEQQFVLMATNHNDQLIDEMTISEWDAEELDLVTQILIPLN